MSVEYICDVCGKKEQAVYYKDARDYGKPVKWLQRETPAGYLKNLCSRLCLEKLESIRSFRMRSKVELPI